MTIIIGARDTRRRFAELLGRMGKDKELTIIERFGKPLVALIPIEDYEKLVTEREARFQVLDRLRNNQPEIPKEDVERDINQAIDAIRNSEV